MHFMKFILCIIILLSVIVFFGTIEGMENNTTEPTTPTPTMETVNIMTATAAPTQPLPFVKYDMNDPDQTYHVDLDLSANRLYDVSLNYAAFNSNYYEPHSFPYGAPSWVPSYGDSVVLSIRD
jgi:hypothetical protein